MIGMFIIGKHFVLSKDRPTRARKGKIILKVENTDLMEALCNYKRIIYLHPIQV